jgi:hypothetical protein
MSVHVTCHSTQHSCMTIPAAAATNASAPLAMSAASVCSSKVCDTPPTEGTKSIAEGIPATASGDASWIAALWNSMYDEECEEESLFMAASHAPRTQARRPSSMGAAAMGSMTSRSVRVEEGGEGPPPLLSGGGGRSAARRSTVSRRVAARASRVCCSGARN